MKLRDIDSKLHSLSLPKLAALVLAFLIILFGIFIHIQSIKLSDPIFGDRAIRKACVESSRFNRVIDEDSADTISILDLDWSVYDIENLDGLNKLTHLKKLYISPFDQKEIDLSNVRLPELESLKIIMHLAKDFPEIKLPDAENLESLSIICYKTFPSSDFIDSFSKYDKIKSLSVDNFYRMNKNGDNVYQDLTFLSNYPHLEDIFFTNATIESLEGIQNLKSLKKIDFYGSNILDLEQLLYLENLESIDMTRVSIPQAQVSKLKVFFDKRLTLDSDDNFDDLSMFNGDISIENINK